MNQISASKNGIGTVYASNGKVFVNGEEISIPKDMNTNHITQIDDKLFIGGHEFIEKTKTFERTFAGFFHYYF